MSETIRDMLIRQEGLRLRPYTDTTGHLTIGVGRNLTDNGITESEAMMMLDYDIDCALLELNLEFPDFQTYAEARRKALVSMMFNLGAYGFMQFGKMIAAIHRGDWARAAREMLSSKWATQVPKRVNELASMMESGE